MPYKNPQKVKEYRKKYYALHAEVAKADSLKYYYDNHELMKEKGRVYSKEHSREAVNRAKKWRLENIEKSRAYFRVYEPARSSVDMNFKLNRLLRTRIRQALKSRRIDKCLKSIPLLGAPIPEVRACIEKQFQLGMSWSNWGNNGWHVDHKIPLASFNLADPLEQKRAFHYTNLQPLWAEENLKKGARV